MANGTGSGGSVTMTAAVSLPVASGIVLMAWAVKPVWPPPPEVQAIVVGVLAPIGHLVYRAIYRKLTGWAGEPDDQNGALAPVPAPVPPPPPPLQPAPPPAAPPVVAPPPQPQPQGQPA